MRRIGPDQPGRSPFIARESAVRPIGRRSETVKKDEQGQGSSRRLFRLTSQRARAILALWSLPLA